MAMRQTEERVRVSRGNKEQDERQDGVGVVREIRDR